MATTRIGFVGIGNMGAPMAKRVLEHGFPLAVFDADPAKGERFAADAGGRRAASLADLARDADIVITMLPNGDIVREVVFDPSGLAANLRAGGVLVDMSSADATGTRRTGAELAARGIAMVDAPVSGGVWGAAAGTLSIMIGADDEEVVARVEPVLRAMGDKLFRLGPLGTGHVAKALNNLLAGISVLGCAEALLMSQRFGVDPARIFEVVNQSTGRSWNSELMAKRLDDPTKPLGFAMSLMAKDIKLAADLARDLNLEAPISGAAYRIFADACEKLGQPDVTAVPRYLEQISGPAPDRGRS
jgi:3-hydroxyisobutyrate dehydrogenase